MSKEVSASGSPDPRKKMTSRRAAGEEAALPAYVAHFKINRLLGQGIIGIVYEAVEEKPPRNVALKVVRPEFLSKSALKFFHAQAEGPARLQHPNFAAVYSMGIAKSPEGLQAYFAGELVSGQALESYARAKQLSNEQRLLLVAQVAEAIHYAHVKGVVHRDLKPANVLIGKDGQAKILDVGVIRCTDADVAAVAGGADIGVLSYMAPEQASGRAGDIDTRTDIYALGVMAFHVLCGRLPYDLKLPEFEQAVEVICQTPAKGLSEFDPSLRGDVERIVGKALEKNPADRYQTALEFAADIRRYADGSPVAAAAAGEAADVLHFARRNKVLVSMVVGLVAALAVGFAVSTRRAARAFTAISQQQTLLTAQGTQLLENQADVERLKQAATDAAAQTALAKKEEAAAEGRATEASAAEQKAQETERAEGEQLKAAQTQAARGTEAETATPPVAQQEPANQEEQGKNSEGLDALLSQGQALLASGKHDEAMDCIAKARAMAEQQNVSTLPPDLLLTSLMLQFPPPLYFNSTIKGATAKIFLLADDRTLVASDLRDVVVIDGVTGSVRRRFGAFARNIRDLAVSPDGALVAVVGHVRPRCRAVFTLADGKLIQFQEDDPKSASVAFSPRGTPLVYCEDGRIMAFDPRDMKKEQSQSIDIFDPHVTFSHSGSEIFVTGSNHRFLAFAADTLKDISTISNSGESGFVSAVGGPDGKSVIVGSDAGVVRHSLPSYNVTEEYAGAYGGVPVLSPSGKILAAFSGGGVHLYDVASAKELGLFEDQIPYRTQTNALAISADSSTLFDFDFYSGLRAWPISSPRFPSAVGAHGGAVRALAISPDSLVGVSSGDDHTARLWDMASGMQLAMLGGHSGLCQEIAFGPDPVVLYSLSADGRFLTWDVESRTVSSTKKLAAESLGVSADGKFIATAGAANSGLVVSSLAGNKPPGDMTVAPSWAECDDMQFSPDGAMLIANTPAGGNVYDLRSFTTVEVDKNLVGGQFTFSHDGSQIFAGMSNGELARWAVGMTAATFAPAHGGNITCLRASADGAIIAAAGSDRTITLSDAQTLEKVATLSGFPGEVSHLALSADGRYLMAAAGDKVYLIDLLAGRDYAENHDRIQAARTALDANPADGLALLSLGLYYASRHADAWAVELLTRAKAAGAEIPALPLARAYWRLHKPELALAEFRRAITNKEAPEYYIKLCMNAVNYPPPVDVGG